MCPKRLQFGGKGETSADAAVIERLFTEPVARKDQRAFAAIPERQGEHANTKLEGVLQSPARNGFYKYFRIGMTTPRMRCFGIKLSANLIVVVNFAIEHDNVTLA